MFTAPRVAAMLLVVALLVGNYADAQRVGGSAEQKMAEHTLNVTTLMQHII